MKPKKFFDAVHAERYLAGSIVRHKADCVFVEMVEQRRSGISAFVKDLIHFNNDGKWVLTDELDLTPLKLGFVNYDKYGMSKVYGAFRIPQRAWKIGLHQGNLSMIDISGKPLKRTDPIIAGVLHSAALNNTANGKFPSFVRAVKLAKEGKPIAFSRRFALNGEKLRYLQIVEDVGELQGNLVKLFDKFSYLDQALTEDINENH